MAWTNACVGDFGGGARGWEGGGSAKDRRVHIGGLYIASRILVSDAGWGDEGSRGVGGQVNWG